MNWDIMLDAIRSAYPQGLPDGLDMIWYVDTSIPSEIEFRDFSEAMRPLRIGDEVECDTEY